MLPYGSRLPAWLTALKASSTNPIFDLAAGSVSESFDVLIAKKRYFVYPATHEDDIVYETFRKLGVPVLERSDIRIPEDYRMVELHRGAYPLVLRPLESFEPVEGKIGDRQVVVNLARVLGVIKRQTGSFPKASPYTCSFVFVQGDDLREKGCIRLIPPLGLEPFKNVDDVLKQLATEKVITPKNKAKFTKLFISVLQSC